MFDRQPAVSNNPPLGQIEALEGRKLLAASAVFTATNGVVTVEGTANADTILVRNIQFDRTQQQEDSSIIVTSPGQPLIEVVVNGRKFYFDRDRVNRIKIFAFRGNDLINAFQDDRTELISERENADDSVTSRFAVTGPATTRLDVFGNGGEDTITGGNARDTLGGNEGQDLIFGGKNNDSIFGDANRDELHGGAGDDYIEGNADNDRIFGDAGEDTLLGNDGKDRLEGNDGKDQLAGGDGADTLLGGSANDTLDGGSGDDNLQGGKQNDSLLGNFGDDYLLGEDGDDTLRGNKGLDTLVSGLGNNVTEGGEDRDDVDGVID